MSLLNEHCVLMLCAAENFFRTLQVYALEKAGGSIIAGVIKQIQAKRANPPPPRDARLPPKPAGQTVGSFRKGLQSLPRAIAAKHADNIRSSCAADFPVL